MPVLQVVGCLCLCFLITFQYTMPRVLRNRVVAPAPAMPFAKNGKWYVKNSDGQPVSLSVPSNQIVNSRVIKALAAGGFTVLVHPHYEQDVSNRLKVEIRGGPGHTCGSDGERFLCIECGREENPLSIGDYELV